MLLRNNVSHITTMNVFGATRDSRKNLIFSDLVVSNKIHRDELTSYGLQIGKNTVHIESMQEKLDDMIKQVSTLNTNDEKNRTIEFDLNNVLNSITNLESRLANIEAFLPPEAFLPAVAPMISPNTGQKKRKR